MQDAKPTPGPYDYRLPSLDGLRAIAILLVIVNHSAILGTGFPEAWKPFTTYLPTGRWGVGLFFTSADSSSPIFS